MTDREATQEVIILCGEDGMAVRPPGNCLRANLMPFAVGKRNRVLEEVLYVSEARTAPILRASLDASIRRPAKVAGFCGAGPKVITTLGSCPEKRAVQRQGGHHARTRNHEAAVYRHRRAGRGSPRRTASASVLPRAGYGRDRQDDARLALPHRRRSPRQEVPAHHPRYARSPNPS